MTNIFTGFLFPIFIRGMKEIPNEVKKNYFDVINMTYMVALMLMWMWYILDPIAKRLNQLTTQDVQDPVIILSLAGFLMLSMWFILTQFAFYCTRWTIMIYREINKITKYIKRKNSTMFKT